MESFQKMSPPVALMVGLNAVMYYMRRTPKIPNWMVPWLIMLLGAITYPAITHRQEMIFTVPYPIVAQAITGLLIGFAAIGSHRLFEQTMWRFGYEKNGNASEHKTSGESKETDLKERPRRHNSPDVGL